MEAAETICGLPRDKVVLHEMVSGGSFGARESKYWLVEVSYRSDEGRLGEQCRYRWSPYHYKQTIT